MPAPKLTNEIISAAILGFEGQKKQIDDQIAELRSMLSGVPAETAVTPEEGAPRKRKKFSAAARKRMAEAQRARWAAIKGTSDQPELATGTPAKAKRKMSAAARKAIGEATRQRWALKKKATEAAKVIPAKKASRKAAVKKKAPAKAAKKAVNNAAKKSATKKTGAVAAPAVVAAAV